MHNRTNTKLIWAVAFVVVMLIFVSVNISTDVHAKPLLGITPTATSEPTATTQPTPTTEPDDPGDPEPPDKIDVQLDCNLTCTNPQPAIDTRVQLIHEGSGWIAEGTISTGGSTSFSVPYGGRWQVYLLEAPQVTPVEAASTLLSPGSYPHLLGVVNANSGTQLVNCPMVCVDLPTVLPETGSEANLNGTTLFLIIFAISSGVILLSIFYFFKKGGFVIR